MAEEMAKAIVVYGSSWCPHTLRALRDLDGWGVDYHYIEVDDDPEAEQLIASWNKGRSIRPTVTINGDVFINPATIILKSELDSHGLL